MFSQRGAEIEAEAPSGIAIELSFSRRFHHEANPERPIIAIIVGLDLDSVNPGFITESLVRERLGNFRGYGAFFRSLYPAHGYRPFSSARTSC